MAQPSSAPRSTTEALIGIIEEGDERLNAQRLHAILSQAPCFCYTVNRELVFTSSIGSALSHLQLKNNQLVGTSLLDLWGVSDPTYEPHACHNKALAGETARYQDVCLGRSLEYEVSPLREDGQVVGVIGVGVDVTEREREKERQTQLAAELRQAQKMEDIGRLAGGVAHDFNNLLTCIIGQLDLATRQLSKPARAQGHINESIRAAESAAALTRQLLAFGRKQIIRPRSVDLRELVEGVQGMLRRMIGESIRLETKSSGQLWPVRADPGQIEQVLMNLIVNARDAISGHGTIEIATENVPADDERLAQADIIAQPHVLLQVSDDGKGMSTAVRAKLFEPFFTTKTQGEGTGLGLSTVYGAVQQNGGTVLVDSDLGHGTTFSIYLPRLDKADGDSQKRSLPTKVEPVRGGNETVLLVEDEPLVLELTQCALQEYGYHVLPCAGPDEALRKLADYDGTIDVLLTDVVMPRINGKELASRVSAFRPDIAVIFSSGYGETIIAQQGVLDEGVSFIPKPYRPEELARAVRQILDAKRADSVPQRA